MVLFTERDILDNDVTYSNGICYSTEEIVISIQQDRLGRFKPVSAKGWGGGAE